MCADCSWPLYLQTAQAASAAADDIPERGEDFAAGVQATLNDIADWIGENEHITEPQIEAIENMRAGINKWLD